MIINNDDNDDNDDDDNSEKCKFENCDRKQHIVN